MPAWQHYRQPHNIAAALHDLQSAAGPVRVIAGGTDLLIDLQQGRHPPLDTLVDITGIPELCEIRPADGALFLGAAVTHFQILQDPLVSANAAALVEACGQIGGPQVRNVATIGGNVAHALPAGDGTIALLALGADVLIAGGQGGQEGRRWLPLGELFLAPGQTVLVGSRELILGFRMPLLAPGEGSAFSRTMRPQGVAIAILNMAAWMRCAADGRVADVRLAVGPAGPVPFRARQTEAALRGQPLDEATLERAAATLADEARLRPSPHRATLDYRRHLIPVLLRRVLETAHSRAMVS